MLSYKEEDSLAASYGFLSQIDRTRCSSGNWSFFIKSNIIVWICSKGWCRAKRKILLDNNIVYQDHKYFIDLEDALKYND